MPTIVRYDATIGKAMRSNSKTLAFVHLSAIKNIAHVSVLS